jgi:hypothetical protein
MGGVAAEIYMEGETLYGRIVALKEPSDESERLAADSPSCGALRLVQLPLA